MSLTYVLTSSVGSLTLTGQPLNTETVVVGGKTYTFQTSLTDVDGNVNIGADAAGSLKNLRAAINLDNSGESAVGAGTDYAASMTENAEVAVPDAPSATVLVVKAKTPGTVGDLIASTETLTNGSWGGAVLASGAGNVSGWAEDLLAKNQVNSEVAFHIKDDLTALND
jgi:hypothetical protein